MSESLILFGQELYKQHDRVAMDSPLGPTLANVFFYYYEKILLQNWPSEFKPVIYRRCSKHHIKKFQNYLNLQHKNISFTSETENKNSISFLDIKISRDNNKFTTSVYCKPTFSRVFTNFGSFILKSHKYNLLFTLLHRAFKLCSNFELFHQEIDKLKTIFENSGYPKSFVDFCINPFQPDAHICAPFLCYVISRHYLPITSSYDCQIFMRDSGIAVLHIYSVCTIIEYTVVSIYYLKYQCWSQNIKTVNFEKANFIKQNCTTKSTHT